MTRFLLTSSVALAAFAAPVQAHVGHLGEVAGHGHWLGAAALGGAIAIGLWAAAKGRRDAQAQSEEDSDGAEEAPEDEELQEA